MDETSPKPARHSDATLHALDQLYATMNSGADADKRDAWWPLVLRIEAAIDGDGQASKAEGDAMRRLREGVSQVYGALNCGQEPSYSSATRAIVGLQHMLESRTTGFDGRRLR